MPTCIASDGRRFLSIKSFVHVFLGFDLKPLKRQQKDDCLPNEKTTFKNTQNIQESPLIVSVNKTKRRDKKKIKQQEKYFR